MRLDHRGDAPEPPAIGHAVGTEPGVDPDLELALYDGSSKHLSSFWGDGKPLFLVFGSCT